MHDGIYLSIYNVISQGVDAAVLITIRVLQNFTKKTYAENL